MMYDIFGAGADPSDKFAFYQSLDDFIEGIFVGDPTDT